MSAFSRTGRPLALVAALFLLGPFGHSGSGTPHAPGAFVAPVHAASAPVGEPSAAQKGRKKQESKELISLAPDGRRGLGAPTELSQLLRLFRRPSAEDREFLRDLMDLEPRLRVLLATTEGLYRDRGFLELLARGTRGDERNLARLHILHGDVIADPGPLLAKVGRKGIVWANFLLDPRVWMRIEVLQDWERDTRDVRLGLAVLRGVTDGWVRLDDVTARTIAKRVDLSASLLRARLLDLSALREGSNDKSEVSEANRERFLSFLDLEDEDQRGHLLAAELESVSRRVATMRSVLFTHRLELQVADALHERAEGKARLEEIRQEVRIWQPQTPEGKVAPADIRRIKKTARRREAYRVALQGLRLDPMDAEMAFAAGSMAQFVAGTYESLSYFDRYLALKSIRVHDDRNWRKRKLTDEENHAIFQIQQFESEEFPGTGGPAGGGNK